MEQKGGKRVGKRVTDIQKEERSKSRRERGRTGKERRTADRQISGRKEKNNS